MAVDACCKALPCGRALGSSVSVAVVLVLLLLLLARPAWRTANSSTMQSESSSDSESLLGASGDAPADTQPGTDPVAPPSADGPPAPATPQPLPGAPSTSTTTSACPPALIVLGGLGGVLRHAANESFLWQHLAAQGPLVGTVGNDLGGARLPGAKRLHEPQTALAGRERMLTVPAVVAATPRRCYPASGECACLLEEDACAAGVGSVIVTRDDPRLARYCASPPLPPASRTPPVPVTVTDTTTTTGSTRPPDAAVALDDTPRLSSAVSVSPWRRVDPRWVVLQARGWIANEAVPALSPFYRCTRTMCATTTSRALTSAAPWPGAGKLAVDAELLSLDSDKYDTLPKPFPAFVQAILYTESHGRHPLLASPSFASSDKDVRISYKPGGHTELTVSICKYTEAQLRMPGLPLHRKTGLVAWMASHAVPAREQLVQGLMEYMPVHNYGPRLHNREVTQDFPAHCQRPRTGREYYSESECIIYHHKFYLALENDDTDPYYHTEKLYIPLAMGTIPVYWGPRTIHAIAPSNRSVLYVSDYASVADLAHAMLQLANDTDAYDAYRAWKTQSPWPPGFDQVVRGGRPTVLCQLCDWVADRRIRQQHDLLQQVWAHMVPPRNTTLGCLFPSSDDDDHDVLVDHAPGSSADADGQHLAMVVQLANGLDADTLSTSASDMNVVPACGNASMMVSQMPASAMIQQMVRLGAGSMTTMILNNASALAIFITPDDVPVHAGAPPASQAGQDQRTQLAETLAQLGALAWLAHDNPTHAASDHDDEPEGWAPPPASWVLLLGTAISAPTPWVAAARAVLANIVLTSSTTTWSNADDAPPDMILLRLRAAAPDDHDGSQAGSVPAMMHWQRCQRLTPGVGNLNATTVQTETPCITDGRTPYALLLRHAVALAMAERGPVHTLTDISLTGPRMCDSLNIYTVTVSESLLV